MSLDVSKKPRMPKSYIDAVKPAAFARVLAKATHTSGAQIKLTVLLLFSSSNNALCCYPHVKLEIGNLIQITTTAPIFQQSHYFRQKYLEIASCAVSLLNNIWVRVEHSLLQQLNLPKISCSSSSLQAGYE